MWVLLGMLSALFLGFYDIAKKKSLTNNAVLTVLFFNTVFCALIFLPFIIAPGLSQSISASGREVLQMEPLKAHMLVVLKSFIVLSSWIMGYYALKHLPITLTGPINAFRPVLVLMGALIIFGEKLNGLQWTGVLL